MYWSECINYKYTLALTINLERESHDSLLIPVLFKTFINNLGKNIDEMLTKSVDS